MIKTNCYATTNNLNELIDFNFPADLDSDSNQMDPSNHQLMNDEVNRN